MDIITPERVEWIEAGMPDRFTDWLVEHGHREYAGWLTLHTWLTELGWVDVDDIMDQEIIVSEPHVYGEGV